MGFGNMVINMRKCFNTGIFFSICPSNMPSAYDNQELSAIEVNYSVNVDQKTKLQALI